MSKNKQFLKIQKLFDRDISIKKALGICLLGWAIWWSFLFVYRSLAYQARPVNLISEFVQGYGSPVPDSAAPDFSARLAAPAYQASRAAMPRRSGGPNVAQEVIENVNGGAIAKSAQADRRIIYTATVDLVTENIDPVEPKLLEMLKTAGGFVADTNQTGASGGQRTGMWKVRVPIDKYDGFLQQVRTLGEVQSVNVNSQDVTEEFVDVTARVNAKKVQEQRLIDLIKNAVGQLDEVLKVEAELARVRGEIERMEGRLRFLKDQTELTTITITVREVKDYKPPEAPTFSTKMRRVWEESTLKLWENSGLVILGLIAWIPFLPIYIVIFGAGIWLAVRVWRKIWPMLDPIIEIRQAASTENPQPTSSKPPTES